MKAINSTARFFKVPIINVDRKEGLKKNVKFMSYLIEKIK